MKTIHILHLEDNPDDANLIQILLKHADFTCNIVLVDTKEKFEAEIKNPALTLILSDYTIPNYNGLVALKYRNENRPGIPFILISGTIGEERTIEVFKAGVTDYIKKDNLERVAPAITRALQEVEEKNKLKLAEEAIFNAFEYAPIGMALLSLDEKFLRLNQAFCQLLGYDSDELLSFMLDEITPPADLAIERTHIKKLINNQMHSVQYDKPYIHKLGHLVWGTVSASLAKVSEGLPLYIILQVQNITERKLAETEVIHLMNHDTATGLPKRRLLEDFINQALVTSQKNSTQIAIFFISLDNFKRVNDTFGYEISDLLLKEIGEKLRNLIGINNFVANLGGDQFVLILTDITRPELALIAAEKISDEFINPFIIDSHEFKTAINIGISLYPNDGDDAATLIKNADIALQRAKFVHQGDYQFCTPEMTKQTKERVELENKLHDALKNDELVLYYQPQVSLIDGKITGAEALLRWKQTNAAPSLPKDLIPIAEETGLIIPIGDWILNTACKQAMQWQVANFKLGMIAINLSAKQFFEANFIEKIELTLKQLGCDPTILELEITESLLMGDIELSKILLHQLKDKGFRIAIDDFGTGYSSLNYLRQFPIDTLKIDQSFVKAAASDPRNAALMKSIVMLGHSLDIKVLAEGVETFEQLQLLRDYGCDEMQGYFFSKPVSANDFTKLLQEGRQL